MQAQKEIDVTNRVQRNGVISQQDAREIQVERGLMRQVLSRGDQMMLVRHVMQAGWEGERHSHPHEQLVYVIRGRLMFTRGAENFEVVGGDSFVVAGGVEHQAVAMEDSEVLDVFAPPREDYEESR